MFEPAARNAPSPLAQVLKGFLPVDKYGNTVNDIVRAPAMSIEGMPDTMRESRVRLEAGARRGWLSCVVLLGVGRRRTGGGEGGGRWGRDDTPLGR